MHPWRKSSGLSAARPASRIPIKCVCVSHSSPTLSLSGLYSHRSLHYCNAHIFSLPVSVSLCLSHTLSCLSVLSTCLPVCQVIHDDQGEKFRRVRHAYELLTDSDARARYDAGLRAFARTHAHTHEFLQILM